jgi:hypothetical protein
MVQVFASGDRSTTVFVVTCVMFSLSSVFVVMRLISKRGLVKKPTWDDAVVGIGMGDQTLGCSAMPLLQCSYCIRCLGDSCSLRDYLSRSCTERLWVQGSDMR